MRSSSLCGLSRNVGKVTEVGIDLEPGKMVGLRAM